MQFYFYLILLIISFKLYTFNESNCYKYWDCIYSQGLKNCKPDCRKKDQKCLHDVNTCHNCYTKVEGDASPYYCDITQDLRKRFARPQDLR